MAEPVRLQAALAASPTGIKQEPEVETNILDGIDFNMIAELASKRSYDDISRDNETDHDQESKRFKKETKIEEEDEEERQAEDEDQEEEEGELEGEGKSLEDGLALLVQNALSNVGDLVDQLNVDSEEPTSDDPMDVSGAHDAEARPAPVSFLSEPEKYVRIANTHALGNLALSLLLVLLQQPVDDVFKVARDADSGYGRSYGRLKRSFDATWQLFSDNAILSADELEIQEVDARTLLELANLAKFGTWLINEDMESLSAAEEQFTEVFQCQLPDIPAGTAEFFVGIKTQKAIGALNGKGPEQRAEDLIRDLLMEGLEEFLEVGFDSNELSLTAREFLSLVQSRRDVLIQAVTTDKEDLLKEKYPAGDVLRGFAAYVKSKLASLTELGEKLGVSALLADVAAEEPVSNGSGNGDLDLDDLSSFFEKTTSGLVQNALAGFSETDQAPSQTPIKTQPQSQPEPQSQSQSLLPTVEDVDATTQALAPASTTATAATPAAPEATGSAPAETKPVQTNGKIDLMTDYKELEALVAESTSNYVKTTLHGLSAVPYQPTVPTSTTESMAAQSAYLSHLQQHPTHHSYYTYTQPSIQEQHSPPPPGSNENLPPNQTFPSAVLYDKARQAALSKSSAHTRREGLHSTRRPWTQEEEKALMAGLDMVKGPHWSQILTLFGQNGTISDILKDRTQVQLKDKARNLKLFFLKTNSEMPYYLQAVTGELKTRAPTQAARKEAEERARLNSEEEQAKLQGIMALAGGLHQQASPQQQVRSSTSSAIVTPGVITPAQAAHQVAAAQHASQLQAAAAAHHSPSTMPVSRGMVMPTPQIKTEIQATTTPTAQQASQSVPQAPARPQAQAHTLHEPQQQQQQSQIHNHAPPQRPEQQQTSQPPLTTSTQNGTHVATPLQGDQQQLSSITPTASVPIQPQQTPQAPRLSRPPSGLSQPATHSPQSSTPGQAHPETRRISNVSEAPVSHVAAQDDDAATEAALLEGLQAVVAQALAS